MYALFGLRARKYVGYFSYSGFSKNCFFFGKESLPDKFWVSTCFCAVLDFFIFPSPKKYYIRTFAALFLLMFTGIFIRAEKTTVITVDSFIINRRIISVEDGLASREVLCGVQDKQGFIWLGTRSGLNRYDGQHFKLFTQQQHGLNTNKIIGLCIDPGGLLWITYGKAGNPLANNGVIQIMDPVTFHIQSFKEAFPHAPIKQEEINFACSDGGDALYIVGFGANVWRYTLAKGFVRVHNFKEDYYPRFFCRGSDYFFSTKTASIIGHGDSVVRVPFSNPQDELLPLLFKPNGDLLGFLDGSSNLLCNYTRDGRLIEGAPAPGHMDLHSKTYSLTDAATGSRILVNDDIIYLRDSTFIPLFKKNEIDQMPGVFPVNYFVDNTGQLWLSTAMGVIVLRITPNRFHNYFTGLGLFESQVRGIYVDSTNNLYAAVWWSFGRRCRAEGNTEKLIYVGHNSITNLVAEENHILRFYNQSIYEYDLVPGNQQVRIVGKLPDIAWSIYPLPDGHLLASSSLKCYVLDKDGNVIANTCSTSSYPKPAAIYRFLRSKDGVLWGAGEHGLHIFDNHGCVIDYFGSTAANSSHRLPYDDLNDFYEDHAGVYWLATNGDGLYRWDKTRATFKHFNVASGLSSNVLYRIEEDNAANLWISTDFGLMRFNTETNAVYTYTVQDGIPHNEFNRISSFKAPNGWLYFGGMNGLCAFDPSAMVADTALLTAPLRITSFLQFNGDEDKIDDKTLVLQQRKSIVMQPGDRFFTIAYMLLDFDANVHRYAYKIEGIDKDWNYTPDNSLRITGLPYGRFVLKIRGQNIAGQWSSSELNIPISVLRPFYLQAWFFIVLLAAAVVAVYLIITARTRRLQQHNVELEQTVVNRTQQLQQSLGEKEILLKEIHHRVKNNLQIIVSLLELQGARLEDEAARKALDEGKGRIYSIALLHHQLYRDTDLGHVELGTFAREIMKQVISVYKQPEQPFTSTIEIPEAHIDIDTAVPLGLILNELMTNSFKYALHTDIPGRIDITLHKEGLNYVLAYRDNGKGLPDNLDMSTTHTLGLRLIYRLSQQIKGACAYRFNNGAEFTITFPVEGAESNGE